MGHVPISTLYVHLYIIYNQPLETLIVVSPAAMRFYAAIKSFNTKY